MYLSRLIYIDKSQLGVVTIFFFTHSTRCRLTVAFTTPLRAFLSLASCSPFLIPRTLRACLTRSFHRWNLGHLLGIFFSGSHIVITRNSWPSALQTCPVQLILLLLRIQTLLASLDVALSSAFVLFSYWFCFFFFI